MKRRAKLAKQRKSASKVKKAVSRTMPKKTRKGA